MTLPTPDQNTSCPTGLTAQIVAYLTDDHPEVNFLTNTPSQVGDETFECALRDAIIHSGMATRSCSK